LIMFLIWSKPMIGLVVVVVVVVVCVCVCVFCTSVCDC
jgi:hypothetical protein